MAYNKRVRAINKALGEVEDRREQRERNEYINDLVDELSEDQDLEADEIARIVANEVGHNVTPKQWAYAINKARRYQSRDAATYQILAGVGL